MSMPERDRNVVAACEHRFKLVGYRNRPDVPSTRDADDTPMDAVLVCKRCVEEQLVGVTHRLPTPAKGWR